MNSATTMDEYIKSFPEEVQLVLQNIRATVKGIVPEAEEAMKYGIPTFVFKKKNLLHFGAYQYHIGFYPTPDVIIAFKIELADYKTAKGSVQFPLTKPMPVDLITQMTEYRVVKMRENVSMKRKSNDAFTL